MFAVEAVGRHLSFTAAAEELGISQPAVSKAVRATEDALGFPLFEREHRGLGLTPKGKAFVGEARALLQQMSDVVQELAGQKEAPVVRACFSSSFVALWMLPRVSDFSGLNPDVALHLEESDSDMVDLDARGVDFSARLGDGKWDDVQSWFLLPERVGAVASPDYVARHPGLADLSVLTQADLIHVDEPKRVRIGWQDWFRALRTKPSIAKVGLTVSDYHSAVDAAVIGQGVALGWEHLVRGKIDQGQLVWIGTHMIETGNGIYLVEPASRQQSEHLSRFRDWLMGQFPDIGVVPEPGS
ncbi:LysR substrate-binding domain-containing protein [Ruegeria sp. 2012CJ41-6]|uniref:LysR substrate-binding domain-containing protein n=1 Tax=Ruegeria spongiae TaxID=2942209 RepID=A0ABT0Q2W5_9RHOB|nr:LysR substrate-binding domain-containing protein [Ruegeria spongiae]MCL6284148.1 LysR substrate-binding domain-containing protein [Ruegeria spongiae]